MNTKFPNTAIKTLKAYAFPIIVFVLSTLVRFVYNITIAHSYQPTFDGALYDIIARNIVSHHCFCLYSNYQAVSRPPFWPFVMSAIYYFFGENEFYVRLFYCFLGSGTCVVIYFFARDLFGRRIGLYSGMIAALYPGLFIYDGWLYSESLYTFLTTSFIYALFRLQRSSPTVQNPPEQSWLNKLSYKAVKHRYLFSCGLLLGFITLTRPNGVLLLGLVGIWGVFVSIAKVLPWHVVLKYMLVIACIASIIVMPWTYRNYTVTHKFVLVSTGMGEVLLGAYNNTIVDGNPEVRGRWRPPADARNHDSFGYTPDDDKADTLRALSWIDTHLNAIPYVLTLHFINMWIPYTYAHGLPFEAYLHQPAAQFMIYAITITTILMLGLAVSGFFVTWRLKKQQLITVYLFLAMTIMQNIAFYSDMRFRAPIEPLLVLLAGGMLWWLTLVFAKRPLPTDTSF